jgi:hypothetical protein
VLKNQNSKILARRLAVRDFGALLINELITARGGGKKPDGTIEKRVAFEETCRLRGNLAHSPTSKPDRADGAMRTGYGNTGSLSRVARFAE